jgi:hypothetical protein
MSLLCAICGEDHVAAGKPQQLAAWTLQQQPAKVLRTCMD